MSKSSPLRPSGLLGTPLSHEVQDAVARGLDLDLTDAQFRVIALAAGFAACQVERMLPMYQSYRYEHHHDLPF